MQKVVLALILLSSNVFGSVYLHSSYTENDTHGIGSDYFYNDPVDDPKLAVSHDHVVRINSTPNISWTAHLPPKFLGASLDDAKVLCGTILNSDYMIQVPLKSEVFRGDEFYPILDSNDVKLPDSFDSREHWSECNNVIGHVRDQSKCGSCWAFGATEAFNGRLCIATKGKMTELLSTGEITSCCGLVECMSMGCNGGQPAGAWNFFRRHGVVTGGDSEDVGTGKTCYPYQFESCSHHVKDPNRTPCDRDLFQTPKCLRTCPESSYPVSFANDRHFASKVYSLPSNEREIMLDIYHHGPVTAAFMVHQDFLMYRSGVYKHTEGTPEVGGHAIVIIGWGIDEETKAPYWLCVNSWNTAWGEKGLFRMLRGKNECGIESNIVTGLARTSNYHSEYESMGTFY